MTGITIGVSLSAASILGVVGTLETTTGLDLTPDYWIDATSGSNANPGTSEGSAWATLDMIETITGTVGQDTVVRVKSDTYDTTSDHFEINGFDGHLKVVFETGCVMDGTAHGSTAQNPIYAGDASTVMTVYGNGLSVQNFSGLSGGTPNGLGYGGSGTTLTAYDMTLSNCSDGISGHVSGHGIFHGITVLGDHNKSTVANVGSSSMDAYRCHFTGNPSASGGFFLSEGTGKQYFENCIFIPGTTDASRKISGEYQEFKNCQIGVLDNRVKIEGRVAFNPSVSILVEDSYINAQQQSAPNVTFRRCYGKMSNRMRAFGSGAYTIENCVINGPATTQTHVIYSDFDEGSAVQWIVKDNIFEAASGFEFMFVNATTAGYLVSAASQFFNNILSASSAIDSDLTTADTGGTVVVDNVTADALIGSADTLDPDDYGYATGSPAIGAATDGGNSGFAIGEVDAPNLVA